MDKVTTTKELYDFFNSKCHKIGIVNESTNSLDVIEARNSALKLDIDILRINRDSIDARITTHFNNKVHIVYETILCEKFVQLDRNAKMGVVQHTVKLSELFHDIDVFTLADVDTLLKNTVKY